MREPVLYYLKTETEYYQAVENGTKKFELRKNNRDYQVRDVICLEEIVRGVPTGRFSARYEIAYIFPGGKWGLEEGYCILSLR